MEEHTKRHFTLMDEHEVFYASTTNQSTDHSNRKRKSGDSKDTSENNFREVKQKLAKL